MCNFFNAYFSRSNSKCYGELNTPGMCHYKFEGVLKNGAKVSSRQRNFQIIFQKRSGDEGERLTV